MSCGDVKPCLSKANKHILKVKKNHNRILSWSVNVLQCIALFKTIYFKFQTAEARENNKLWTAIHKPYSTASDCMNFQCDGVMVNMSKLILFQTHA